jgi:hypothetical protein
LEFKALAAYGDASSQRTETETIGVNKGESKKEGKKEKTAKPKLTSLLIVIRARLSIHAILQNHEWNLKMLREACGNRRGNNKKYKRMREKKLSGEKSVENVRESRTCGGGRSEKSEIL